MKPIVRRTGELLVTAFILLSTAWCLVPPTGIFFKWWEDHTFVLMLSLLGAGLVFFCCNAYRLTMVSFGACALLCLSLHERSQAPLRHSDKTDDALVTIAHFQLPRVQSYEDENFKLILNTKADLISLQEVALASLDSLHEFFTCCGYPYYECVADEAHQTAMVVYSQHPFHFQTDDHDPHAPVISGVVELSIGSEKEKLVFFSTFLNPIHDEVAYARLRKRLQNYAHRLQQIDQPVLACGNYHLVSWSRDLYTFRTVSGLKESRRGFLPTLPHGRFSLLDPPFDHIFYSNHFKCINFKTISSSTTPHLGIVGTYQFERQDSVINVKTAAREF